MKIRSVVAGAIAALFAASVSIAGATPAEARTLKWVGPFNTKALCQYNVDTTVMNSWQLVKPCELHNNPGDDGKWWFKAYM